MSGWTDLDVATMMKDTRVTEQPCLEDAPFVKQISHRISILDHTTTYHHVFICQTSHIVANENNSKTEFNDNHVSAPAMSYTLSAHVE